ncbi:hypothetical protein EDD21DRAFT_387173 [Dissophora ornata]|nr:hypothetical protein EDD21DRAFT_387173 [Dissophora ornata]
MAQGLILLIMLVLVLVTLMVHLVVVIDWLSHPPCVRTRRVLLVPATHRTVLILFRFICIVLGVILSFLLRRGRVLALVPIVPP